jgi:hypothetical protein
MFPAPVSEVKVGGEYCFDEMWGVGLMGGPVLNTHQSGTGFSLYPDLRLYYGFRSNGRGFVSIGGQYRRQTMGAYSGTLYGSSFKSHYTQSSSVLNVLGAEARAGFVVRLTGPLHLEMGAGFGFKWVKYDRKGLTGGLYKEDRTKIFLSEDMILRKGTFPYDFIRIGFSWLLGSPLKKPTG